MLHWIESHGFECVGIFWVFSAAVGRMPAPKPNTSGFYAWAYGFLHDILQLFAANLNRVVPGFGPLPPKT